MGWIGCCFAMFHTIWVHSGPFGCLTKLGAKRAETCAKVRAMKSRRNFLQRTYIRSWVLNFFGGAFASHLFASTRRGGAPVAKMGLSIRWFGVGVSGALPLSLISIAAIMALGLIGMAIVDVSHEVVV